MRSGVDEGMGLEDVEGACQVPQVLGEGLTPGHHGVDQVGVAGVVVVGVPVEPLAEAAQVGGEHDVATPGQLVGVVGVGGAGALEPARPRTCPARGRGRPAPLARADRRAVGHEQIGGHRHRVLGVEDDLVAPVPVALDDSRSRGEAARASGIGPSSSSGGPGSAPATPGRAASSLTRYRRRRRRRPAAVGSGSTCRVSPSRTIHEYQGE